MSDYKGKKIWVVSDVEDIAKDKAKQLAKLDKRKIGPWLTDLILKRDSQADLPANIKLIDSNDIRKIMDYLVKIQFEITELHIKSDNLSSKVATAEKKTFFDKFLK